MRFGWLTALAALLGAAPASAATYYHIEVTFAATASSSDWLGNSGSYVQGLTIVSNLMDYGDGIYATDPMLTTLYLSGSEGSFGFTGGGSLPGATGGFSFPLANLVQGDHNVRLPILGGGFWYDCGIRCIVTDSHVVAAAGYMSDTPTGPIGSVVTDQILAIVAVPEPATWALMIAGFGLVGYSMRRRQRAALARI